MVTVKKKTQKTHHSTEEKDHVLCVAVAVAVTVLVIGMIIVIVRLQNPRVDTKKGTAKLAAMEEVQVSEVESRIQELEEAERKADEERANRPINEKFESAFVIGDSMAQGLCEYEVLDSSYVQADQEAGVYGTGSEMLETQIEKAVECQPQVLFLAYGKNDIESTDGDAGKFISAYRNVLKRLKEALPETKIYVNSILPVQQSMTGADAGFARITGYNHELEELCREEDVKFIETGELVKEEDYAEDGIHVSSAYYVKWADYMAEAAKL